MSAYQYSIVYRAGKDNANADALSRLPLPETPVSTYVPLETAFFIREVVTDTCKGSPSQAVDRERPGAVQSKDLPATGLAQCGRQ